MLFDIGFLYIGPSVNADWYVTLWTDTGYFETLLTFALTRSPGGSDFSGWTTVSVDVPETGMYVLSLDGAIYNTYGYGLIAQMNGRWTLRYTDDDADWPQTDYFFDVAVNGITSSSLGRVEFTTPLPGTTVSPRPTLAYTSTFDTPDWAVVWNPAGDIDAAVNRSFTYTNPLRAGEYWFGALEGRDRLLAGESFTLTSAGQVGDGPSLALAAGQVQLSSYGFVTNVTVAVPAPSVLAVLGVGWVFAGRRRRSSPPLVSNR